MSKVILRIKCGVFTVMMQTKQKERRETQRPWGGDGFSFGGQGLEHLETIFELRFYRKKWNGEDIGGGGGGGGGHWYKSTLCCGNNSLLTSFHPVFSPQIHAANESKGNLKSK